MRVLLVEDDLDLREALTDALEDAGWEVETTSSGLDAVLRVARDSLDAVLLDVQVERMSGLAVQRVVRDLSGVPVVVMSALPSRWRKAAFAGGASACIPKPFDLDNLLALLKGYQAPRRGERTNGWATDVRQLGKGDLDRLARIPSDELHGLPFGVLRLDRDGVVTEYNAFEQTAAGFDQQLVVGRRFADVAPCTVVKRFLDRVDEGFRTGNMDDVLRFVFPRWGALAVVTVRLYFDPLVREMWLFVSCTPAETPYDEEQGPVRWS